MVLLIVGVSVGLALMYYKREWILGKLADAKAWVTEKFNDVSKF